MGTIDLNFLLQLVNPIILGICLLVGYVLKTAFEKFPNKYIPLAALCTGTLLAVLLNLQSGVNAEVILGGMISGLASTGLYEMLRNLLKFDDNVKSQVEEKAAKIQADDQQNEKNREASNKGMLNKEKPNKGIQNKETQNQGMQNDEIQNKGVNLKCSQDKA